MSSSSSDQPSFVTRLGLAVVEPRWAFAVAGDRRNPGRSGSDLLRTIGIALMAGQLRALVVAVWLAAAVHPGLGVRMVGAVVSAALTLPLGFLLLGAVVLWIVGGQARNVGRAFDLACVPAVPLVLVLQLGVLVALGLGLHQHAGLTLVVLGAAFGWSGALVALGFATARVNVSIAAVPPPEVAARGQRAGRAVLALLAVATLAQGAWVVTHLDELRPVAPSEPPPTFALPEVGKGGALGPRWALTSGARERPVVLDFWATWCGVCLKGLPKLDAFRAAHPEVEVVSINVDDAAAGRALFDQKQWGLRLLYDDAQVANRYGVTGLPHLVVIGKDGMVKHVVRGHPSDLEALVE